MPSHPSLPPLLTPYICNLPASSLTLLTSTLGATTNWLVLRCIHAALQSKKGVDVIGPAINRRVVLVSWLRDADYWKDSGRKLGLNFQRVHNIDALNSGLGLRSGRLADVEESILEAIKASKDVEKAEDKVLLVLDGLDFLLAATALPMQNIIDMVSDLREVIQMHSLIHFLS